MQIVLLALLFLSGPSASSDLPNPLPPRALVPSQFHLAAGSTVELQIASAGTPLARWPESEIAWFFHRSDGKQTNQDTLAPVNPGGNRAALVLPDAGVSMLGVQFKPRIVTLSEKQAATLQQRFAERPGSDRSQPRSPAKGSRLRIQSAASALVRLTAADAPAADDPSAIATSKSGQKAELRAMFDPTRRSVGDELPLRIYADGDKAPAAAVTAVAPDGTRVASFSNSAGFVTIAINAPGIWRVEFEQLLPAREDDAEAGWTLYTGSLTFQTTDAVAGGQGGTR